MFTSKVDLGTGTGTALGQIVAEELDVAVLKIRMEIGDTTRSVDQGRTSASRTLERAGPQMRQAAAAARQELLTRASAAARRACESTRRDRRRRQRHRQFREKRVVCGAGGRQAVRHEGPGERRAVGSQRRARRETERPERTTRSSAPRFRDSICRTKFAAAVHICAGRPRARNASWTRRPPAGRELDAAVRRRRIDQNISRRREGRTEGQLRRHRRRDRVGRDSCRARAEGDVVRSSDAIPGGSRGDVRLSAEHEAADRARGDRTPATRRRHSRKRRRHSTPRIDGRSRCTA